jgi:hypothetical protein
VFVCVRVCVCVCMVCEYVYVYARHSCPPVASGLLHLVSVQSAVGSLLSAPDELDGFFAVPAGLQSVSNAVLLMGTAISNLPDFLLAVKLSQSHCWLPSPGIRTFVIIMKLLFRSVLLSYSA